MIFAMALLLLAGWLDPSRFWLIYLVVLTGIDAFRWVPWRPLSLRPRLNLRMAPFVLSVLLLAGAIDPSRDWMIALTVAAGLAMVAPGLLSFEDRERDTRIRWRRHRRREQTLWDGETWS
jgi:hypothetical protein